MENIQKTFFELKKHFQGGIAYPLEPLPMRHTTGRANKNQKAKFYRRCGREIFSLVLTKRRLCNGTYKIQAPFAITLPFSFFVFIPPAHCYARQNNDALLRKANNLLAVVDRKSLI